MSHRSRAALLTNLDELERLLGRSDAAAKLSARAAEARGERERDNADFRIALERADLHSYWRATPRLFVVSQH